MCLLCLLAFILFMKKIAFLFLGLFLNAVLTAAQDTVLITLRPGPVEGKDAMIRKYLTETEITSTHPGLMAYAWTHDGINSFARILIEFDLSGLPENSEILSASLSLYHYPWDNIDLTGHSKLSGSNASVIRRITGIWSDNSVTWANQPSVTSVNEVYVPQSASSTQDFLDIDITDLVLDGVDEDHVGLMLQLGNETRYRALTFGSSDNPDSLIRPMLKLLVKKKSTCIVMRPDGAKGKDATISSYNGNTTMNRGNEVSLFSYAWTHGGIPAWSRILVEFDLSDIPSEAIINSAELSLYHYPKDNVDLSEHSSLSGSNAAYLERITGSWLENTVSWSNQPATTTLNRVELAQISGTQNYENINVAVLVTDALDNADNAVGFMLKLQNESYYRALMFGSSENADLAKRPKLAVCYTLKDGGEDDIVTGLDVRANDKLIRLMPNPVVNDFVITLANPVRNPKITLINSTGESFMPEVERLSDRQFAVKRGALTAGMYFMIIADGENIVGNERLILTNK